MLITLCSFLTNKVVLPWLLWHLHINLINVLIQTDNIAATQENSGDLVVIHQACGDVYRYAGPWTCCTHPMTRLKGLFFFCEMVACLGESLPQQGKTNYCFVRTTVFFSTYQTAFTSIKQVVYSNTWFMIFQDFYKMKINNVLWEGDGSILTVFHCYSKQLPRC